MIWHDVDQRSPAWFALRLGLPTASNFHRIITPKKLKISEQRGSYRNLLLAEFITGVPMESFVSKSMERGTENEDKARSAYEMLTDTETTRGGFFTAYDGMAGCSPDALIGSAGDLEIKCVEIQTQVGYAIDGVEDDHKIQMQGRLLIEEREYVDLFSYNEMLCLPILRVNRHEETIKAIDAALRQFIDELLAARLLLEQRYGPFSRPQAEEPDHSEDGITQADEEMIIAGLKQSGALAAEEKP